MIRIELTPALLTGHPDIDAEHQALVTAINTCMDHLESGAVHACAESFDRLGLLLLDHFQNEENIMRELGYRKLDNHMGHHVHSYQEFFKIAGLCSVKDCRQEECITEMKSILLRDLISADMDFKSYLEDIGFRGDDRGRVPNS